MCHVCEELGAEIKRRQITKHYQMFNLFAEIWRKRELPIAKEMIRSLRSVARALMKFKEPKEPSVLDPRRIALVAKLGAAKMLMHHAWLVWGNGDETKSRYMMKVQQEIDLLAEDMRILNCPVDPPEPRGLGQLIAVITGGNGQAKPDEDKVVDATLE